MAMKGIERLVVVVDIRAWLQHPNPSKVASLLQQSVRTFLASMPPSCRWGFKLFDSSVSPFSSRCKINKLLGSWACSTRFDSVLPGGDNSPALPEVLSQFCSALNCLQTELHKAEAAMSIDGSVAPASASYIASSLMELLSDYVWNPLLPVHEEALSQSDEECTMAPIQLNSNLVILFSTFPMSKSELAQFLGIKSAISESDLRANFNSTFRKVLGSFTANNVHLCWVDVPLNISTLDCTREIICNDKIYQPNILSSMLCHLGWSFTFLDVLVTGLRMVPFSVLWQGLAHPWFHINHKPLSKAYKVSIQVRDVNGKLIRANLCKAETICFGNKQIESLVHVNTLSIACTIPRKVLDIAKQHILAQTILRPKISQKGKLDRFDVILGDGIDKNFVGDFFFASFQQEGGSFEPGKPAWQLLMLHLAREERLAIIDVGSTNSACFAMLEPVTVHLAVLSIVNTICLSKAHECVIKGDPLNLPGQSLAMSDGLTKSRLETESSQSFSIDISSQDSRVGKEGHHCDDTQAGEGMTKLPLKRKPLLPLPSSPHKDVNAEDQTVIGSKKRRVRPCSNRETNLYHSSKTNLEDLYTRSMKRSKTLKVLSCWMRQTKQDQLPVFPTHNAALLAAAAGKCSFAISDVGSDNPSTSELASQFKEENLEGMTTLDNSQPLNIASVAVKGQIDTQSNSSGLEDTVLSSLPVCPALLEVVCHDRGKVAFDDLARNDANAYIASLKQKIIDCLSSPEIDLYSFSQRVVLDVQSAFAVINSRHPLSEDYVSPTLTQPAADANICSKIIEVVLLNPKQLATKYKNCKPPESASQTVIGEFISDNQVHSSEEKVREHELQILFRMEILSLMHECSGHSTTTQVLVNEICQLLESIQFNLPGGILEGESLLDFSNNVIKHRYIERLPSIVDEIYTVMEFNGHDNLSEVEELEQPQNASELVPAGSEAHHSLGTEEDHFSNSDNPCSSSSWSKLKDQSRDLSLQRALFKERTRCTSADAAVQKLMQAEAKRERAKRFSHFASSCRDLLRVTVTPKVSLAAGMKKCPKSHGRTGKSKPLKHKSSEREVILQTPFSSAKQQSKKPPLAAKKLLVWNW